MIFTATGATQVSRSPADADDLPRKQTPTTSATAAMPPPRSAELSAELKRHWRTGRVGTLGGAGAVRSPARSSGGPHTDERRVARLGVVLRSYPVRDEVWLAIDDGRLERIELWLNLAPRGSVTPTYPCTTSV